jgi:hypothetical protein
MDIGHEVVSSDEGDRGPFWVRRHDEYGCQA